MGHTIKKIKKKKTKRQFVIPLSLNLSKQLGCLLGKPSWFGLGPNGQLDCLLWINCSLGFKPP